MRLEPVNQTHRSLRRIFATLGVWRNCLKPLQFGEDSLTQSAHDLYYNPDIPLETVETHRDFHTSKEEWNKGREAVRPSKAIRVSESTFSEISLMRRVP